MLDFVLLYTIEKRAGIMEFNPKKIGLEYEKIIGQQLSYEVFNAEQEDVITTNQDGAYKKNDDLYLRNMYGFLYHGIRFQTYLEKLESIFRDGKILAGRYIKDYYCYGDNCNKGEYVSLLNVQKTDGISFTTFIDENISLLVTPYCDAIETKYVDFNTWDKIKDLKLKQIYSYLPGECMCKDFIPLEYVKAIGVPYRHLIRTKGRSYADKLIEDIVVLMNKYNISFPIVAPGSCNKILVAQTDELVDNTIQQKTSSLKLIKK